MDCYFCWVNDKIKRPATMMAGQDFEGRKEGRESAYTYKFYPICEDHASTWNNAETVPYPMFKLRYMVNESSGNYMSLEHALRQHGNEAVTYALNTGWVPTPVYEIVTAWASQFHKPEDFMNVLGLVKL